MEIGILFDFYGKLLSDRQLLAVELYYIQDFSLAEIAEELNITRQGVFDTLKRAEQKLYNYEDNLKLVKKFLEKQEDIRNIINISNRIKDLAKKNNIKAIYEDAQLIENIGIKILD